MAQECHASDSHYDTAFTSYSSLITLQCLQPRDWQWRHPSHHGQFVYRNECVLSRLVRQGRKMLLWSERCIYGLLIICFALITCDTHTHTHTRALVSLRRVSEPSLWQVEHDDPGTYITAIRSDNNTLAVTTLRGVDARDDSSGICVAATWHI